MKNVLITGVAGFIGANFAERYLAKRPKDLVLGVDCLSYAGSESNLDGLESSSNFQFFKDDINHEDRMTQLIRDYKIDTIVNFAAETHVDRSILDPGGFIKSNVLGTCALLNAARTEWLQKGSGTEHRFHQISTDEVYGTLLPTEAAFTEDSPFKPNSPYSASKAAADHFVRAHRETFGMQVSTTFCSNNFGNLQYPEKLLPLVITNILADKPLPIYGDGKQVRDWLYVDDHATAILKILESDCYESFNIGASNELENLHIVELVCQLVDNEFSQNDELSKQYPNAKSAIRGESFGLVKHVTDRLGHDRRYAINSSKYVDKFGPVRIESFEVQIARTVKWYLENEGWWQPTLAA